MIEHVFEIMTQTSKIITQNTIISAYLTLNEIDSERSSNLYIFSIKLSFYYS